MQKRVLTPFLWLMAAWFVMLFTHEMGHILGGWCSGGTLVSADLIPWHLPHSLFDPDPYPLVTLWSGPILGVVVPLGTAILVNRDPIWFIAHFCLLANGSYLAMAWFSADRYLDTPRLLDQGASPITIGLYCLLTIGFGYYGFRRSCISLLSGRESG